MTRVMVVGADMRGEQALLARLRGIVGQAAERIVRSRHLDECDLLVIRDLPSLRRTAARVAGERPRLLLWIEHEDGRLCDGRDARAFPPALDTPALLEALAPFTTLPVTAAVTAPAAPATAVDTDPADAALGAKPVTRLLRQCLQAHQGHAQLLLDGTPLLLLDFGHDLALPACGTPGIAELAQRLGGAFQSLALEALTPARFDALAARLPRLPLHPLLWQTAQHSGHWQDLDRQLEAHARVRLLRWPDFRVLARQHDGFRLCSLLLKKPCTVAECSQMLGLETAMVREFIHTAYLCGYAAIEAPAASAERPATPQGQGPGALLARMWRSLRARTAA